MHKKELKPSGRYYFVIIGRSDRHLFEMEFSQGACSKIDRGYLNQFIAHAALDLVDGLMWNTHNMYLKCVDRYEEWLVSAFVTASRARFIMVHDGADETGIRNFFNEMLECYIKHTMNPLYTTNSAIKSIAFEKRAELCAKKYLLF